MNVAYFETNHRNELIYISTHIKIKITKFLFKGLNYHCTFDIYQCMRKLYDSNIGIVLLLISNSAINIIIFLLKFVLV